MLCKVSISDHPPIMFSFCDVLLVKGPARIAVMWCVHIVAVCCHLSIRNKIVILTTNCVSYQHRMANPRAQASRISSHFDERQSINSTGEKSDSTQGTPNESTSLSNKTLIFNFLSQPLIRTVVTTDPKKLCRLVDSTSTRTVSSMKQLRRH